MSISAFKFARSASDPVQHIMVSYSEIHLLKECLDMEIGHKSRTLHFYFLESDDEINVLMSRFIHRTERSRYEKSINKSG